MSSALAALSGALFALGLTLSGMTMPARVLGFLDVTGAWDPSLVFVMAGAIAVYAPAHYAIRRFRARPLFDTTFHVPARGALSLTLFGGAALFGIGWGLSGLCPGPALAALGALRSEAAVVVATMFSGTLLGSLLEQRRESGPKQPASVLAHDDG
jgi:uncharacterized protein